MEPERDWRGRATLVDLLDRVFDKGVVLYADIIISVAGIPLIGVNLRAALAGMETMVEYGVMQDMDVKTRMWEAQHKKIKEVSLMEGEELDERTHDFLMDGEKIFCKGKKWHRVRESGILGETWKPGYLYLTNKRLCWWYELEGRICFQVPIERISGAVKERRDLSSVLKDREVLDVIYSANGTKAVASFSGKETDEWEKALNRVIIKGSQAEEEETETCPQCGNLALAKELLEKGCSKCSWVSPRHGEKLKIKN